MGYKSNRKILTDLSAVQTDIHSHLIPGLDDGSQSTEESVAYITQLKELGYKKLIITPHVISDGYNNTPETILNGLNVLKTEIVRQNIDIELEAAAEYYLDDHFLSLIEEEQLLYFGTEKYVLFESSYYYPTDNIYQAIFLMHTHGYKPVYAHPERYTYYHHDFNIYENLKEKGVFFQMNLVSLLNNYSQGSKKMAEQLIDHEMIDFVGTDVHNENYLIGIKQLLGNKHIYKLVKSGKLLNYTL